MIVVAMFIVVKFADKIQTEVTAKRGEIDKLNSKVRWMEERIEVLEKVRAYVIFWCVFFFRTVVIVWLEMCCHCEEILRKCVQRNVHV